MPIPVLEGEDDVGGRVLLVESAPYTEGGTGEERGMPSARLSLGEARKASSSIPGDEPAIVEGVVGVVGVRRGLVADRQQLLGDEAKEGCKGQDHGRRVMVSV